MAHRERRGVLPLLALLLFLNSAVCYCLGFSHDHAGHGQDTETPHDCECLTTAQPLPADQQVQTHAAPLAALAADPVPALGNRSPLGSFSGEVRPPGEHGPPVHLLHCTLLC